MTYYGTVYNSAGQSSLTPIVDISTQLVTLANSQQPAFNLNTDLLGASSALPAPSSATEATQASSTLMIQPSAATSGDLASGSTSAIKSDENKITRTRSMYTTLTHFITFYSGTKTQLSTIQEISPTVVTEYIDRTLFEQLQQQQASGTDPAASVVVATRAPEAAVQPTLTLAPLAPATVTLAGTETSDWPATTTTTTTTSGATGASSPAQQQQEANSSSSNDQAATTTTTPTTASEVVASVTTTAPAGTAPSSGVESSNEQRDSTPQDQAVRVLASSSGPSSAQNSADQSVEAKQAPNIIELSDLIAANSSQSGRVALAGNLGAAIKDIVQLLSGNRTASSSGTVPTVSLPSTTTTIAPSSDAETSSSASSIATAAAAATTKRPARVFGQNGAAQRANLQGSIATTQMLDAATGSQQASGASRQPTPELALNPTNSHQQRQAAATIFFGDDGDDERKKAIKTVWPGAHSTHYVTSTEPSTRSLVVTTTKVYYTRDASITVTSSFTTLIAPRTFVSTIAGTRTTVNQLHAGAPTAVQAPASATIAPPNLQHAAQNASSSTTTTTTNKQSQQPSRQDSQASSHRLSIQGKQQRQQAQAEQQQRKQQQQQQLQREQAAAKRQASEQQAAANKAATLAQANINQCTPACKQSANEVCKFTPHSDTSGVQGTFACACRPGYQLQLNAVGQRQCLEVQSFVVLLRLLQVGDQQLTFKRELQSKSSSEFKQLSKLVREHVKRAYMTSELTRDRFVGAEVANYARSLAPSVSRQLPSGTSKPSVDSTQLGSTGVIVNMTVHLAPASAQSDTSMQLDEATLKEELTKRLSMRQAAALAAAAAAAASTTGSGNSATPTSEQSMAGEQQGPGASGAAAAANVSSGATGSQNQTTSSDAGEPLPNPNALFLADVEQVHDLDECASPALNDCHEAAMCINEPGSYRCDCREWPDLNPLNPGRQCGAELKSCDYCNNRGDCVRAPSLLASPTASASGGAAAATATSGSNNNNSNNTTTITNNARAPFATVCQCHKIYLGRRCEINGLLLATLLPIFAILLIVSVCLVIYCCRRWRKRSAMSKGFRNIGMLGGTLDRKAMLESSSESSDTHQRPHHLHHAAAAAHLLHHHHHHHAAASSHRQANGAGAMYDATSAAAAAIAAHLPPPGSDMTAGSSSAESSPRQMAREHHHAHAHHHAASAAGGLLAATGQTGSGSVAGAAASVAGPLGSIPQQIVIPRARHNQVNYAVHRGQVYMW